MPDKPGEILPQAENEQARARAVLDQDPSGEDELRHTAGHIAQAIAADPADRNGYALLDELADRTGDASRLFRGTGGDVYIGQAAALSYLLARSGDADGALISLCAVAREDPGRPWAEGWLAAPEGTALAGKADPRHAATALSRLAWSLPDPAEPETAAALAPFLEAARRVAETSADPEVLPDLSALARRLGAAEEAVSWCQRAEQSSPSARTAIMLGYALRDAGRRPEMYKAWRRAHDRDKNNIDLCVDIGENLARDGRARDGLSWLEKGLALEPGHAKAFPSACALRYQLDGDVTHLIRLADWGRDHPEHRYAGQMLARACQGLPWLGTVPPATEATAALLRYHASREALGERITVRQSALSALEVPSVMDLARARGIRATGLRPGWSPATPEPSIRVPVATGRYRLWSYAGFEARPVPPEPPSSASDQLHSVAAAGWPPHPVAAHALAAGLAGLAIDELLGLMAHPVPVPDTEAWRKTDSADPTYWRRSAQGWACLGLLHHRPDEPWESSARREVLADLLLGAEDWATDAALYALTVAAWTDPGARGDVAALAARRFTSAAAARERRAVSVIEPMATLVLHIPQMPPEPVRLARQVLREQDRRDRSARTGPLRRLFRKGPGAKMDP